MRTIGIIPARMGSSRFPGKPLVSILGAPMVVHVYFRARMCTSLDAVYVATPDQEIRASAERYGVPVIMTSPHHERATDRVAEAVERTEDRSEIVVNIQGDEPMLYPEMVDAPVRALAEDPTLVCTNPVARIRDRETFENRNVIKVVTDRGGLVLYMSREPIPTTVRLGDAVPMYQQLVVLPFRRDFLKTFTRLPQTPLEQAESVDMLRVLEYGYKIKAVEVPRVTISVDVPSDVARIEAALRHDPLVDVYLPRLRLQGSE